MSNYVFGTTLSYSDYLQARSFERSLKSEISSSAKSIIASNQELQRENIAVLRDLSSSVSAGFESISIEISDLSTGIRELNATFQWGFSELLTQAGRINDSLEELVRLAKTPAQTWAYEQFEIARDADRKGLFEEALEYLNRAINGYGGQTGYNLEYRFHFLLGRIRLGSFRNYSKDIVRLPEAERSFLYAARYAAQDAPKEAAQALLAAGWAAYCQGEMTKAGDYTRQAVSFDPKLAEAYFQLAKVSMHLNNAQDALAPLQQAIELDRGYTIKAAADEDFKRHENQVMDLFDKLREGAKIHAIEVRTDVKQHRASAQKQLQTDYSLAQAVTFDAVDRILTQADSAYANNTYYGYLDTVKFCEQAKAELIKLTKAARVEHEKRAREITAQQQYQAQREAAAEQERVQKAKQKAQTAFWVSLASPLCCAILAPTGLILGIRAHSQYKTLNNKDGVGFAVAAIVIASLMIGGFALYVIVVLLASASTSQ